MPVRDWNLYLQEELMDASLYLEKLRSVHEDTDESIKNMSKNIRDMQTATDSLRESLEKMMDDALGTDLQPEIVDLLKATKNSVENTEWQLEVAHTLLNSKYMRILNMPSS
jgi:hypothetical protein